MRAPVRFGKYLLLDRVSVGGMAEVFKAKSYGVEGFEKIVAIKRILPSLGADADFVKMFVDEAKIAGQLAHANICQIFELGRIEGAHFIAMEFIWGKDLLQIQNRLRKLGRPMTPTMAAYIIGKACEGLDHAHRKKDALGRALEIVHRDCSPQNILVSYEGEVKVIDFGIAKAAMRNSSTVAGVLKGKFSYMSPEQVRGLPLDRRSDIFALGTVLYESVTGTKLFEADTDFATLDRVRAAEVRAPRKVNPAVPVELERIILRALARDPAERYPWCSDFAADLQRFLLTEEAQFGAKELAGWVREAFTAEIERERAQLESYKQLDRDGNLGSDAEPAPRATAAEVFARASSRSNFTQTLEEPTGERTAELRGGALRATADDRGEGDTLDLPRDDDDRGEHTVAGAPAFDDSAWATEIESPRVAAPPRAASAGPAPVAAAERIAPPPAAAPRAAGRASSAATTSDFAEDVPTEIFGNGAEIADLLATPKPAPARAPSARPERPPTQAPPLPRAATGAPGPSARAASAPPARPPTAPPPVVAAPAPQVAAPAPGGPAAPTVLAMPAPRLPAPSAPVPTADALPAPRLPSRPVIGAPAVRTDITDLAAPVDATMRARRTSPLRRDVLIGIAIAVGVLVVAAVLRFVVFAPRATPVPAIAPGAAGSAAVIADAGRPPAVADARPTPASDAAAAAGAAPPVDAAPPPAVDARPASIVDARPAPIVDARGATSEPRPDARVRVRPEPVVPAADGYLQVFSTPSAEVLVDGRATGMSTPIVGRKRLTLSPGRHRIGLKLDGKVRDFTVTIRSGETATLSKTLTP